LMHFDQSPPQITGADVIVRKAEPLMAGQAPSTLLTPPQTTRNELQRLAHDDIGACTRGRFVYQIKN